MKTESLDQWENLNISTIVNKINKLNSPNEIKRSWIENHFNIKVLIQQLVNTFSFNQLNQFI